ncbi:urease accessory protein UreD [Oceanicola granulosus HTCC2516]|uniref:Urease accessory protein UreD n=1 Tax=Oceanicola granulosus (strain ATCC BAA-861 / DSM 15982 / KCTC 12143 / HTCC2516) TaxID=314256 RepID=Q2CJ31_OCEGH|nr:urease accessory protein UreD [Oceanicola granulosus]EAR52769.1 urease accessory protein UreD [Oceanicola granulosus HTCC2516]
MQRRRAITLSTPIDAPARQPRAIGRGRLSVRRDAAGRTRLADLRQLGSTKLLFPQVHRAGAECILINTAGGVTGGDRFEFEATLEPGAALTLTTQAAERAYRAQPGEVGRIGARVTVRAGARLDWLPQELILFDRSALHRRLVIALEGDARLLMAEPLVFGRALMGERLGDVRFRDSITILRDGRPLYLDALRLEGDAAAQLARPAVAGGAGAMASVVLVHPGAAAHLAPVRAALPATAGASLLADDVLVVRHLAADSFPLRRDLLPVLERLGETPLPTSWRL